MVLSWWRYGHLSEGEAGEQGVGGRVGGGKLLLREVSERYLVPMSTLHDWQSNEQHILASKKGERANRSQVQYCQWPELEDDLYKCYLERRNERKAVRRG